MKNILKIAAGSLTLIHGAMALGEENTPDPSDFSVEPVGVRYLKDGKVVTDSEREGNFYDFPVAQMWRENPNGTDLVMFLEPKHDNTFVCVDGRGGQVTSLVDSTGKSLLEFPGEPLTEGSLEVVYWSDFQKVRVPFEVKVNLNKQSEEMRQYNKRIREVHPGFFTR